MPTLFKVGLIALGAGVAGMVIALEQGLGMYGPATILGLVGMIYWFLCMPAGIIMLVARLFVWADRNQRKKASAPVNFQSKL